jgi:hypothetical protein
MKRQFSLFTIAALVFGWGCSQPQIKNHVPSLDEIAGRWVSADTITMEPSLRNFRGQAVINRDMTSISWFASAPYSGGYHTGALKINGSTPQASMFRWMPYESLRKTTIEKLEVLSSTRMLPDEDGIFWRIEIANKSEEPQDVQIELDAIGFISKYGGDWQWWYPYPKMDGITTKRDEEVELVRKHIGKGNREEIFVDELIEGKPTGKKMPPTWPTDKEILNSKKFSTTIEKSHLFIDDSETDAVTGFAFVSEPDSLSSLNCGGVAQWNLSLKPGEKRVIRYFMTYADSEAVVRKNIMRWKRSFDGKFDAVKSIWQERWNEIFKKNNAQLSGTFPVLETEDTIARRVYYTGPLTMLYLLNTNLPQQKRVILTGGPKWGATISFFWDNTEWSMMQAVTDPLQLKQNLRSWIKIDPSKYYGIDNFGGKGVGNAYSANYWALFQLMRSYLTITKDYEFLNEVIEGKTVLQTLEHYATNWQRISSYGNPGATDDVFKLADFGSDEWNLLECVPTYKHIVPSFNAGYIWMMRETASFYKMAGDNGKAEALTSKANEMLPLLMKLYAGNGVWNCLYPDQKTVEVRHCLDFMFMGRYLSDDLSAPMKQEMVDFVERELMTDHWMRAQSLLDSAARNSDRPDHGPLGAYDGWPAGTMDAMVQMGYAQKAFDFYRAIEPVTHEGSWAQAHELWGENKDNAKAKVRIAERGWHARDAMAGIGMSQVMLKCFFGFNPDAAGNIIKPPQDIQFEGTLHHVLYGGKYYSIRRHDEQISFVEEKN